MMIGDVRRHEDFVPIRECNNTHFYTNKTITDSEQRLENRMDKIESKMWAIILLLIVNLTSVVTGITMLILEKNP